MQDELFIHSPLFLSDIIFISSNHSFLFWLLYIFQVSLIKNNHILTTVINSVNQLIHRHTNYDNHLTKLCRRVTHNLLVCSLQAEKEIIQDLLIFVLGKFPCTNSDKDQYAETYS